MLRRLVTVLILAAFAASAQSQSGDTPPDRLLRLASQEADPARKVQLMELFVRDFPSHPGGVHAWLVLLPHYLAATQYEKVFQGAERALALDPAASHLSYPALQACEALKDVACIKTWAARTVASATAGLAQPKPSEGPELEAWKRDQDYAAQVIQRADYSLYATGLQTTDPAVSFDMLETLRARNAASPYLAELAARCFAVQQAVRRTDRAVRVAEFEQQAGRANEDMLLTLADAALRRRDFAASLKLAALAKDRVAGDAKRAATLGLALWIAGSAHGAMEQWLECDRAMRAALPHIGANNDLLPGAYFYLGLANFHLSEGPKGDKSRTADARKFTTLCAGMKSPYQALAQNNLISMGSVPANTKPPKW